MIGPWLYNGQPFYVTYPEILANRWNGFIYRIDNTVNGRAYIGKKSFHTNRKRKGRPRGAFESTWQQYWGSCAELEKDIYKFTHEKFTRNIVSLHPTSRWLSYAEEKALFGNDVLTAKLASGERAFYNGNIRGSYFLNTFER